MVMGCILPPPVILALGMKVVLMKVRERLKEVKRKLMMVYGCRMADPACSPAQYPTLYMSCCRYAGST
jgi:hypothetical protein